MEEDVATVAGGAIGSDGTINDLIAVSVIAIIGHGNKAAVNAVGIDIAGCTVAGAGAIAYREY